MNVAADTGLEFLRQALALRGYRQQILAADIANSSTPGFKAIDLDFRQALAAAAGGSAPAAQAPPIWLVDDARHIGGAATAVPSGAAAAIKYRVDGAVTLDGNSVDLGAEKAAAAENSVQYLAATTFATQIVRMLSAAVGGAAPQSSGGA